MAQDKTQNVGNSAIQTSESARSGEGSPTVNAQSAIRWLDPIFYLGLAILVFGTRPWNAAVLSGLAVASTGFVLWMVARVQLGESFSLRVRVKTLVTRGLYSRFQHPIYLFGGLAYLGLAIAWGRWPGYVYIALIWAVERHRSKKEEAALEFLLGDQYRQYREGTWF